MTIHLCRDFLTLPSASQPGTNMYLTAMFLRGVMRFNVHTSINFDIESSYIKGQGERGSINLGGSDNIVWVPDGSYTQSIDDINRILVLRSDAFPLHNSGLFRIITSSADPVLGTGFLIDYRSSEFPQVESGTLSWRVYTPESDAEFAWLTGSNGLTGSYNSKGQADNSRIMFSSPSGYHVRLCLESGVDRAGAIPCGFTIAPGVGPTGFGSDFDNVAGHLHGPMWFDTTSSLYRGTAVGLSPYINGTENASGQLRFTAVGDTDKSSIALFTQNVSFVTGGTGWCVFGIPEDEQLPVSDEMIERLFIVGYGNTTPNLTWHSGFFNDGHAQGVTWSRYGFPMPMIMSSYADIRNLSPHVRSLTTATDTPFLGLTELSDVELLGGVMTSSLQPSSSLLTPFAARRIGRLPMVRQGRSNFGDWTTTADKSWLHTQDGIFIPWGGPQLSGSTASSSDAILILTSSLTGGTGIQFFEPDPPMEDPYVQPPQPAQSSDKDATRYRKTYSYHRQQIVEVNIVKGGSNTPPPKR